MVGTSRHGGTGTLRIGLMKPGRCGIWRRAAISVGVSVPAPVVAMMRKGRGGCPPQSLRICSAASPSRGPRGGVVDGCGCAWAMVPVHGSGRGANRTSTPGGGRIRLVHARSRRGGQRCAARVLWVPIIRRDEKRGTMAIFKWPADHRERPNDETGWGDGRDVRRVIVARNPRGIRVWIFRTAARAAGTCMAVGIRQPDTWIN